MALTNRTELLAAIAGWLNRGDLTSAIADEFVPLAEAEMRRRLRRATEVTTIYISAGNMNGPSDMAEPISLHLDSASPAQDRPLRFVTAEMLAERKARSAGVTGRPDCYAFYDGQLQFAPVPDQSYDGILLYYQQLTPLTSGAPTNDILTYAPDAYLYGALLQSAAYLEHDERIPTWQAKFDAAIDQLNAQRDMESYSAGRRDVRLPVVFG